VVGATTAFRVGAGCVLLLQQRSGPLVSLAVRASFGPAGPETQAAEATLREELVALARESAELSWRELRRGVDALDSHTRPADESLGDPRTGQRPAHRTGERNGPRPRPYRVKP
jgi:hypothetical protein